MAACRVWNVITELSFSPFLGSDSLTRGPWSTLLPLAYRKWKAGREESYKCSREIIPLALIGSLLSQSLWPGECDALIGWTSVTCSTPISRVALSMAKISQSPTTALWGHQSLRNSLIFHARKLVVFSRSIGVSLNMDLMKKERRDEHLAPSVGDRNILCLTWHSRPLKVFELAGWVFTFFMYVDGLEQVS